MRVRLQSGPHVAPETARMLKTWEDTFNVPVGYCIDAICAYIRAQPDFKLPLGPYPGKRGPRPKKS